VLFERDLFFTHVVNVIKLIFVQQKDCVTVKTFTSSTPNSVDVEAWILRNINLYDQVYMIEVDSSGNHISRHHDTVLGRIEDVKIVDALCLVHITGDFFHGYFTVDLASVSNPSTDQFLIEADFMACVEEDYGFLVFMLEEKLH